MVKGGRAIHFTPAGRPLQRGFSFPSPLRPARRRFSGGGEGWRLLVLPLLPADLSQLFPSRHPRIFLRQRGGRYGIAAGDHDGGQPALPDLLEYRDPADPQRLSRL